MNILVSIVFIITSIIWIVNFIKVIKKQQITLKKLDELRKQREKAWDEYIKFKDLYINSIQEQGSISQVEFYYRCATKCWNDYVSINSDTLDAHKKELGMK